MGLSLYVMMRIFLLLAARNPSVNRAVIVFAAWLNIAHATVMTVRQFTFQTGAKVC
jgi:Family of unknown function (DUF6632)